VSRFHKRVVLSIRSIEDHRDERGIHTAPAYNDILDIIFGVNFFRRIRAVHNRLTFVEGVSSQHNAAMISHSVRRSDLLASAEHPTSEEVGCLTAQ
jgi:hypothetical protein